jgi:hypothetical protein
MGVEANITPTIAQVPAALRDWLAKPRPMLINGKWVSASSGKYFDVYDPATAMLLAKVAEGDAADIDLAVRARAWRWNKDRGVGCPRPRAGV